MCVGNCKPLQQFVNLGKVICKNLTNSKVQFFIISDLIGKTYLIICKNNFDTMLNMHRGNCQIWAAALYKKLVTLPAYFDAVAVATSHHILKFLK